MTSTKSHLASAHSRTSHSMPIPQPLPHTNQTHPNTHRSWSRNPSPATMFYDSTLHLTSSILLRDIFIHFAAGATRRNPAFKKVLPRLDIVYPDISVLLYHNDGLNLSILLIDTSPKQRRKAWVLLGQSEASIMQRTRVIDWAFRRTAFQSGGLFKGCFELAEISR